MSQRPLYDDTVNAVAFLNPTQFNSTSQASGVLAANVVAGAQENYITQSGATALTTATAAAIFAAVQAVLSGQGLGPFPTLPANFQFYTRVINTNAGTLTLTAGAGVTITGPATLATNTWRDYLITLTGVNTCTFQSVGVGTAP